MTMTDPHPQSLVPVSVPGIAQSRRTTSGRAIRVNTTRPANYYARPFSTVNSAIEQDGRMVDASGMAATPAHGFFPALQYFSDAITALPKEVMKQFTLMKEVEAKIHGPHEKLGDLLDSLTELPVPQRKRQTSVGPGMTTAGQGLLYLTANDSLSGSTNASLINGVAGINSAQASVAGSVNGEDENEEDRSRRGQYHELRMLLHSLLANLDEKNVVLAEANRVLGVQETRLDSVMPHIDQEINEEARLGSMMHWAYSDNRQKKQTTGTGAANRRDVAATNSLAAAANAIHETEIAQARRDAGREATREKTKGKRLEPPGDSDFDDKPRRGPKAGKGKGAGGVGLGISPNGEPATKRKKTATEKGLAAAGMERSVSATGKAARGAKDTPRSTPTTEPGGKKGPKAKPGPQPAKRRMPATSQASQMLAGSPLISSFNPASMEPPPSGKTQNARSKQNGVVTKFKYERTVGEEENSRPESAAGRADGNVEKTNGKRRPYETVESYDERPVSEQFNNQLQEASEQLQRENWRNQDGGTEIGRGHSRSGSNSQKTSGRGSNAGTPRGESFNDRDVPMSRTRSTRSRPGTKGDGHDSSSSEPQTQVAATGGHQRNPSNSHLVKQLAPFNRSPDLDRHKLNDDLDEDLTSLDGRANANEHRIYHARPEDAEERQQQPPELEYESRRASVRRPASRRNTFNAAPSSPVPASTNAHEDYSSPRPSPPPETRQQRPSAAAGVAAAAAAAAASTEDDDVAMEVEAEEEEEEEEYDESEHDPDDPNEQKYCYCNRGSYGEMVACDNDDCPREWFHLGCTELKEAPAEEEVWYCRECRPKFRKGKGRGNGRGRTD